MYNARSLPKLALAATVALSSFAVSPATQAREDVMPMHGAATINVANMDKSMTPCQDFYEYANGTWLKNTPIPGDYASWGTFQIIDDRNLKLLKTLLEEAANKKDAAAGSNDQLAGDFYASGMDEKKIEADGIAPLQKEIDAINSMKSNDELRAMLTRLHSFGINVGFGYGSGQDFKDSTKVIAQASQRGLGLPDRDYYTNTDDNSKKIREQYLTHIANIFKLLGDDQSKADAKAKQIMAFETKLAEASMKNTDLRVPEKIYHKMTIAQCNEMTPHFSWDKYNADLGFAGITEVNVGQPDFFKQLDSQLATGSLDDWKTYLTFHLVTDTAQFLSSKFVEEEFDFSGRKLQGKKENLPRWKRVIHTVNGEVGQPVGQLYVRAAFSGDAKERALEMVKRLKAVLREEIEKLDWMGADTKKNAIAKLDAFNQKIGYPDKWRDYNGLKINRDSYVWNVLHGEEFEFKRQLAKIGKPVDRTDWLMNPQEVNAYYQAEMNEIVFPAGILQPPFFDPKADDATNFGSMGMIIGHEMTHGFDDEGSKFDGAGNMKDWWTEEDKKRFQERVDLIVNQFDGYTVAGDTKVKGKLVSGEAAADLGGLTIAYKALEKSLEGQPRVKDANGFTPEERFFISFAQGWATNTRLERERLLANTNPHPSPKLRVNGTVANMDTFAKTFGAEKECKMMLPPEKRCHLW